MPMNTILPDANSFRKRNADHRSIFSATHRAQVKEVHVEKGTCVVKIEKLNQVEEVTFPLLGLSTPPSTTDSSKIDYKSSAWGRYIPQVGDVLLVGFGSDGVLHALGYGAVFYTGLAKADAVEESTGGINWSEVSGKVMKPGDWDFKSARQSNLYLGDRAKVSSGANSIAVNGPSSDINISSPLIIDRARVSEARFGSVRRLILPTDTEEDYVPTVRGAILDYAQEATWKVKWNNSTPSGASLAEFSIGDVMEDSVTGSSIRISDNMQPVRRYFAASDTTGLLNVFEESVDAFGNYALVASTATAWNWSTNLSKWEISNLSTKISSNSTIELSSIGKFSISGVAGVDISGNLTVSISSDTLIQLGGTSASEPYMKGATWLSLFQTLVAALISHTHPTSMGPSSPSVELAVQLPSVLAQAPNVLSTLIIGK